jgi:cell filamentation protein
MAADGKKYLTNTLDSEGIIALAKHFPNKRHKTITPLY